MMNSEASVPVLPPTNSEDMLAMMQRNNPTMYARFQSLSAEEKEKAMQNMLAYASAVRSGQVPGQGHGHSHGPGSSGSCRHSHAPPVRASQPVQLPSETTPPSEMGIVQAVQYNELERVKELIESGAANVNTPDNEQCYPLHWAAINNHVEIARYLIGRGAIVDIKGGDLQSTPLHWSCRQGCTEVFFLLIDNGAAIDSTDVHGVQPIHLAAEYNQIKMVAFLLGSGIDVDCKDNRGFTPLLHAAIGPPQGYTALEGTSHVNCVQLLLAFDADINYQEPNSKYSALHLSAGHFNAPSFSALIYNPRVDLYLTNKKNQTPMDFARLRSNDTAADVIRSFVESNKTNVRPEFMQRFVTNSTIRCWVSRFYVALILVLIGLVANMEDTSVWIRLISTIFLIIAISQILNYFFFDNQSKENFALSYLVSATLLMYTTYILYLEENRWTLSNLLYHFLTIYGLLTTYTVRNVNPGYVNRQTMISDGNMMSREKICLTFARDPRWTLEQFCPSCLIRRPLRSKHCPVDRTCIAKFDHHCAWLGACIGFRNHFYFIRILICGMVALHIWLYRFYQMVSADKNEFTLRFLFTQHYENWLIYIFILTCFNGLWVTLMTCFHLINSIYYGLTLNERLTGLKYAYFHKENTKELQNPFKKQILRHFLESLGFFRLMTFFGYSRIDWTQVYDLSQIRGLKLV